jgi:hypothetical protein
MNRAFLQGLLVAAILLQGGIQAAAPVFPDVMTDADCGGHGTDGDCCPDGAIDAASCQIQCGAVVALTGALPVNEPDSGRAPASTPAEPRAGPAYLPLNPPPIA